MRGALIVRISDFIEREIPLISLVVPTYSFRLAVMNC